MMKPSGRIRRRIAIIGGTGIEAQDISSLVKASRPREIILIGNGREEASERVSSVLAQSFNTQVCVVTCGSYSDVARADIAIIAASVEPIQSETATEHLLRTADAVRSGVRSVVDSGFDGVMLIITDPIDMMCYVAMKTANFPTERIIGLGTNIDKDARAQLHSANANTWCSGTHFNTPFLDLCDPTCEHFECVMQNARAVHMNDLSCSGNRISGLATCVSRICKAILNNEREILPISAFLSGEYDESGMFLTVPCVIGHKGVERVVNLPTQASEKVRMHKYAAELRGLLSDLGLVTKAAANTR